MAEKLDERSTEFSQTVVDGKDKSIVTSVPGKTKPQTPGKTEPKTPGKGEMTGDYGSLETPIGRRSARIAIKSSQKEH